MTIILDTDPGVDDMLALLLLLSSTANLKMISLTFGNCKLIDTLKNTLSLFKIVDLENQYRSSTQLPQFSSHKPEIYIGSAKALTGAETIESFKELEPLEGINAVDATDVHGSDGLAGIHHSNPEFDAPESWFSYFGPNAEIPDSKTAETLPFVPGGSKPSWLAILDLLKTEPENSVTIVCIGPLTNLAKAQMCDPLTFSRVKEVVSMGATLRIPGNITPLAEFNVFADPIAAAHVYALTSNNPDAIYPGVKCDGKRLNLTLFPLDITQSHHMHKHDVSDIVGDFLTKYPGSVLAQWIDKWLNASFANYGRIIGRGPENASVHLHDPLTVAYVLERHGWEIKTEDVRVEAVGQWAKGMTVVDNRGRAKQKRLEHDVQLWLTENEGNIVNVAVKSPFQSTFNKILLNRIMKQ